MRATPFVRTGPHPQQQPAAAGRARRTGLRRRSPAGATGCSRAWRTTRASSTRIPTTRRRARSCGSTSTSSARRTSACPPKRSARTLETMMGSRLVTTFVEDGEEYDVILQARADDRAAPADLENLYVRSSRSGELVPLSIARDAHRGRGAGHAQPLQPPARDHDLARASRPATRSARRSTGCRRRRREGAAGSRADRLQRPVARVQERGRRRALHVRDGAADRVPGARRAVRELHPSVRDHADRAAGGDRRAARALDLRARRSTSSARSAS